MPDTADTVRSSASRAAQASRALLAAVSQEARWAPASLLVIVAAALAAEKAVPDFTWFAVLAVAVLLRFALGAMTQFRPDDWQPGTGVAVPYVAAYAAEIVGWTMLLLGSPDWLGSGAAAVAVSMLFAAFALGRDARGWSAYVLGWLVAGAVVAAEHRFDPPALFAVGAAVLVFCAWLGMFLRWRAPRRASPGLFTSSAAPDPSQSGEPSSSIVQPTISAA